MGTELNFFDYWKIIKNRWKIIVAFIAILVVTTGGYSYLVIKPEYQASATILVQTQSPNGEYMYNDIMANQKLVKTYTEILKSRQIAEDVAYNLGLDVTTESLLGKIKVSAASDSLVTTLTATDQDPRRAVDIVNGFALSFSKKLNNIMKVDNISILDVAKLPENPVPSYPKPALNMAIAFVLGLFTGVLTALLLEFLDKTVKNEEEIEELLGIPVLGVISKIENEGKRGRGTKKSA